MRSERAYFNFSRHCCGYFLAWFYVGRNFWSILNRLYKKTVCLFKGHVMLRGSIYVRGVNEKTLDGCFCFRCGKSWYFKVQE